MGEDTIEHTQAQTAIMSVFSPQGAALRSLLGKLIAEQPQFNDALAQRLSGLSVEYALPGQRHPLAGCRAPNLKLSDTRNLFGLLRDGRPLLIDFARVDGFDADGRCADRAAAPCTPYRCPQPAERSRRVWAGVSAALIRPDGYVAWASDDTDAAALTAGAANAVAALHDPQPAPVQLEGDPA
ncbi:hypothetical protein [Streptomyces sp. NPDC045369]|uniref:aromatic-ring hydroxylase C-terminal domain-containing protein n=1 Tax=Streptomyces sp. NPDC045369 TaxID=3155732 RepID=UPI0033EEAF8D